MLQVCADPQEGPVGSWGVRLQDRKLPSEAWCAPLWKIWTRRLCLAWLSLSSRPFCRSFILPCTGCQRAPEHLRWGFPTWFALGNTLSNGGSSSLVLGHVPALLRSTLRSAGSTHITREPLGWELPLPAPGVRWRAPGCGDGIQGGPSSPQGAWQGTITVHYPTSRSRRC